MKLYDGKEGRIIAEFDLSELVDSDIVLTLDDVTTADLNRIGTLSDGYHTPDELYEFRKMYNAVLFNEWANFRKNIILEGYIGSADKKVPPAVKYSVHKSWKHNDGEPCFGGGWFIVSAMLPTGLISNHYKAEDWDLFKIPEVEKALYEFDGHTGQDVLARLEYLTKDRIDN